MKESSTTESKEGAREALEIIEGSNRRTRAAICRDAGTYLAIWGMVYTLVPLVALYLEPHVGWLANGLVVVGVALTIILGVRSPVKSQLGFLIGIFWWVAFGFAVVWLIILSGENFPRFYLHVEGKQTWGFGVTVAMMVFVLMGLVMRFPLLIILGILVTGLVLTGYFVAWEWTRFWIWMATCSGGPLLLASVWCKLKPETVPVFSS